ncbi:hypothetical protein [Glaciihabitans sp. dw_435]|uniref:hypothetical protein n=1 Tax=Glaciihabitans sp. dw_435 TaxID=2720081 RepID=UPI001BD6CD3F|nr:hypothetical protein [Glaciihabitans sp. dw_435]
MSSASSTTVVFIGRNPAPTLGRLNRLTNVRAASLAEMTDGDAGQWINQSQSPYVVHDRDPLAHVAHAWVEFFDDQTTLGTLDFEIERALQSLSAGGASLPDYYIIDAPEELSPTWKHWWLGVLPDAAPTRVIPWDDGATPLARLLGHLPTGRSWPDPGPWLHRVARQVPDRVGLGEIVPET